MRILLLCLTLLLTSCQNSALSLLQAISLDPCEIGEVEVNGNFDISSNPLVAANAYIRMTEVHTAETIPRDCPGYQTAVDPPPDS